MLNLLNAIAAGTVIYLAFLVFTVRRDTNRSANRWLAAFLLVVGLIMLDDSLLVYGIYERYPHLLGILNLQIFAIAPPLYLMVSQFVAAERRFRWKDLWHFLPSFLFLLLSLPFLFSSKAIKLEVIKTFDDPMDLSDKIFLSIMAVQIVTYLFFSFRKLKRYRSNIENITASPDSVRLDWLWYFLWSVFGMVIIWFTELFVMPTPTREAGWYSVAYFVAVFVLGYFALRQKEVFPYSQKEAEEVGKILEQDEPEPSERRPVVDEIRHNELKISLLQKMEIEKPYLDTELNLPKLARMMRLSVHEISELVNIGFGENFAQFVNRYRVEESKRLLLSEKHAHLSMVGIAFEAGFNSKTAFNTAFKKLTGMTPSVFQKEKN